MPHDARTSHATEQHVVDPRGFDPDAEALRLVMKVVERARVARSFARIAAGVVHESAKQASTVLRAHAGAALAARTGPGAASPAAPAASASGRAPSLGFQRLARAAADAATEVTAEEVARILTALEALAAPRPEAAPPPSDPASTTRIVRDDAA